MALQKVLVSGLGLGWREEVGPSSACRGLEALVREGVVKWVPGAGGHPGEGGLRGALGNTCFLEKKMVEWRNSGSHSPGQPQGELGDG